MFSPSLHKFKLVTFEIQLTNNVEVYEFKNESFDKAYSKLKKQLKGRDYMVLEAKTIFS